jgi:hypothetical protein
MTDTNRPCPEPYGDAKIRLEEHELLCHKSTGLREFGAKGCDRRAELERQASGQGEG